MSVTAEIHQFLINNSHSATFIFLSILLLSLFTEDLGIFLTISLSMKGYISPILGILAIIIGLFIGTMSLYYIGNKSKKIRYLRYRLLTNRFSRKLGHWIKTNVFIKLFIIRFIPGIRLIAYLLSGYFSIPTKTFIPVIVISSVAWAIISFSIYYSLSDIFIHTLEMHKWILVPIALASIVVIHHGFNKIIYRYFFKK